MDRHALIAHLPSLRRYARALTGDAWQADDLVQDTLERACVKWRLWLPRGDLRAWLFTLMHNIYCNQLRAVPPAARSMENIDDWANVLPAPEQHDSGASDLQRCLLRLPTEQRTVLLLVTLEDLDYATVARILDIPVGTVMSRLSRARHRLRELLDRPAPTATATSPAVTPLHRLK